jgi:hypothetical protein
MGLIQKVGEFMTNVRSAFNQTFLSSAEQSAYVWDSTSARMLRYQMGWSFYEGNQYEALQSFAQGMKTQKALYKYVRNIYNPSSQVANFYTKTVWRGGLDMDTATTGAIPIDFGYEGVNETQLATAIITAWQNSNWNVNKNVHVLHGVTMGDSAIYIRDDVQKQQARIEILHPSLIKAVEMDNMGYVKSYIIEEQRRDSNGNSSQYRETAEHGEGDTIIFRTYRNGGLYAWEGNTDAQGNPRAEWEEPYGFVPLVLTQHVNEGHDWGKSETQAYWDKINEINDQASLLNDQVRKVVRPFKLANFKKAASDIGFSTPTATTTNTMPGREVEDIVYVDKDAASITAVVSPLDIAAVAANIEQMWTKLEDDLPEIRKDIWNTEGGASGKSIMAARGIVEGKVQERRTNYDNGIVRALQMCISIGGFRGYEGNEGFDLSSYKAGKMDFAVADRPVFPESAEQKDAEKAAFWSTVGTAIQSSQGMITFEMIAKDFGWSDEKILEYTQKRMPAVITTAPIDPITGEEMML